PPPRKRPAFQGTAANVALLVEADAARPSRWGYLARPGEPTPRLTASRLGQGVEPAAGRERMRRRHRAATNRHVVPCDRAVDDRPAEGTGAPYPDRGPR